MELNLFERSTFTLRFHLIFFIEDKLISGRSHGIEGKLQQNSKGTMFCINVVLWYKSIAVGYTILWYFDSMVQWFFREVQYSGTVLQN